MKDAIQTTNLVKCYGKRRALDGLTLSVPASSILGLVGANGAGKTTWMMTVAGFLHIQSGSIDLLGSGPYSAEAHAGRISILPQDSDLPLASHPLELLAHYGMLQGLRKAEALRCAREELTAMNLGDRLDSPIRSLSHGMRKRVMIAQCFIGYPEVILLDEPLSGLDPREIAHAREYIAARKGRQTIVISSHDLHDIELICTHIALIEKGHTVSVSPLETLTSTSSRLVYRLTTEPVDFAALQAACPAATFGFDASSRALTCSFPPSVETPESVNRKLLPALLAQTGLLSIEQGNSLEKVYLNANPA